MKPLFTLSKLMLALTIVLLGSLSANAQKIPFQGKLLENGEPVDGQKTLVFSIADPEWTETHENVQVTNGLYSLVLGSITDLPAGLFNGVESLSLNVSVDGTALTHVEIYAPIAKDINGFDFSTSATGENSDGLIINQNVDPDFDGVVTGARILAIGEGTTTGDVNGIRSTANANNRRYNAGVWGEALGNGDGDPISDNYGLYGDGRNNQNNNYGVYGRSTGGIKSVGVYGTANGASEENWAGYFDGDTRVTGDLTVDGVLNANIDMSGNSEFSATYDPNDPDAKPALSAYVDGTPIRDDNGTPDNFDDDTNLNGVAMKATAETLGYNIGILGEANGDENNGEFQVGVYGSSYTDGSGSRYALRGDVGGSNSGFVAAVRGLNSSESIVDGITSGGYFDTRGTGAAGSRNFGVYGAATKDAGRNVGVYGRAQNGDQNYAGWFDGDVQINGSQIGLGKKDWEDNPDRPYLALRGTTEETDTNNTDCNDPDTPETEFCTFFPDMIWMEVFDDGEGNEMGGISLRSSDGKEFRLDANGIDANSIGINLNDLGLSGEDILSGQNMGGFSVSNDENGNDPTGASGALELRGTNTLNARLTGQNWENADRPVFDLYGSHGNGDGWYWENAVLRVDGDGTNDWGSLGLYKSAEGLDNHQEMVRLDGSDGSGSFSGGLLNINTGNEAPFGDYSRLRLDNLGTDAHIEFDGTGWMVLRGEDGTDKVRFNNGGSGYIAGDLTVDGDISGNFNINLDGTSMSRDDILNGQNLAEFYVGNDENGNDPGGATGAIEIKGTNTLNARLMGQFWENADRPVFDLYGSHGNGDGWYWENAAIRVDGDGTNDWGILGLYKSAEGVDNHQEMVRLDGSDGSASFIGGKVSINPDGDDSPGDGELNLGSTDNSSGIRMYGKLDDVGGSRSHIALDSDNGNHIWLWGTGDIDVSSGVNVGDGNITLTGSNGLISANSINVDEINGQNIFGQTITTTSDRRLKTNILPLNNALDNVLAMRGVSYNWLDKDKSQVNQIGVIAQEVEEVYPEFVHTNDEGMKSVNYSQMVAVLIEAIKELNTKITTLETENASLKASLAEVDGLKSQMKNLETLVAKLVQNDAVTTTTQQQ